MADQNQIDQDRYRYLQLKAKAGGMSMPAAPQPPQADMGPDGTPIVQEQHPDITIGDRLITKNLGSNPQSMVDYLKQQHPNLMVQADAKGNILAKRQGEPQWKVLDPDTGFHPIDNPGEALKDIGDVGYDVLSGVGSGLASAAGGAAGALAGGIGALPGAALAGGGSNAVLEAARQGLGSLAGLKNNMSGTDIGVAGLTGAAAPLLFGTGATAAQLAEKGLTGDALDAAVKSQSGLPMQAFRASMGRVAPSVGGVLSGTGANAVRDLQNNLPAVQEITKDPTALTDLATNTLNDTRKTLGAQQKSAVAALENHVAKNVGDAGIDLSAAIKPWDDKIAELEARAAEPNAPGAIQEQLDAVKKEYSRIFGAQETSLDALKSYPESQEVRAHLQGLQDFDKTPTIRSPGMQNSDVADKLLQGIAKDSYNGLNGAIEEAAPGASDLRATIKANIERQKWLQDQLGSPRKFINAMKRASGDSAEGDALRATLQQIDAASGTNLDAARGTVNAAQRFRPGQSAISTALKRTAGGAIGGLAGYGVGRATGVSPWILGGIGALAGGGLTGPKSVRALVEASQGSGGALTALPRNTWTPIWNMLQSQKAQGGQ